MARRSVKATYTPTPLATARMKLPAALDLLLEQLAEHVHDVWAKQRIKDGWRYGPARDDALKTHPGLVPYADLSEAEKAYDRNTAAETLRAIVKLGYTIQPR